MIDQNERFLMAWLRISSTVSNERIVSDLSFNEALVCDVLYYGNLLKMTQKWTATDLCKLTHMHKTLMNRTIKSLEKKKIILREPDDDDKRRYFVQINPENFEVFLAVHENSMKLVRQVTESIGQEKTEAAIEIFHNISETVDQVLYQKGDKEND